MSETKWTPGPWLAQECIRSGWDVVADDGHVVETTDEIGRYGPIDRQANAHLIAAAPDLYEALRASVLMCINMPPAIERMAEAALAKARGEQ
jgi:hypothetical protein